MPSTRKRDWILKIRIGADEIDFVRRAYQQAYGVPWSSVTRAHVESWAEEALNGEIESANADADIQDKAERDWQNVTDWSH